MQHKEIRGGFHFCSVLMVYTEVYINKSEIHWDQKSIDITLSAHCFYCVAPSIEGRSNIYRAKKEQKLDLP